MHPVITSQWVEIVEEAIGHWDVHWYPGKTEVCHRVSLHNNPLSTKFFVMFIFLLPFVDSFSHESFLCSYHFYLLLSISDDIMPFLMDTSCWDSHQPSEAREARIHLLLMQHFPHKLVGNIQPALTLSLWPPSTLRFPALTHELPSPSTPPLSHLDLYTASIVLHLFPQRRELFVSADGFFLHCTCPPRVRRNLFSSVLTENWSWNPGSKIIQLTHFSFQYAQPFTVYLYIIPFPPYMG